MSKIITLITFILLFAINIYAQEPIIIKEGFGTTYMQDGELLTQQDLKFILSESPEAISEYNKSMVHNVIGSVFAGVGGFCVGYPIGTMLGGGEPNWGMAGIGAGLICVAIPFSIAAKNKLTNAVNIYNDMLNEENSISINFGPTENGIGLCLRF